MSDWVLVPREPTEAMVAAIRGEFSPPGSDLVGIGIYRATLSAAPAPDDAMVERVSKAIYNEELRVADLAWPHFDKHWEAAWAGNPNAHAPSRKKLERKGRAAIAAMTGREE